MPVSPATAELVKLTKERTDMKELVIRALKWAIVLLGEKPETVVYSFPDDNEVTRAFLWWKANGEPAAAFHFGGNAINNQCVHAFFGIQGMLISLPYAEEPNKFAIVDENGVKLMLVPYAFECLDPAKLVEMFRASGIKAVA